jgi:putative PIG3 family NAD(P)H quinone oxidoreductase
MSMQDTMWAVEVTQAGGPEVLQRVRRPVPKPRPGEVLVEVAAAGLNGHDLGQRRHGSHPVEPGETDIPGLEIAGTIIEVGEGVTGWRAGDRVCALVRGGGYAQFCTAVATQCLPIPAGLTMVEAASLPETCFTVWANVYVDGAIGRGSLLVHGGNSGIGITAIQIAAALGNKVYATATSAEKAEACARLGADRAIDTSKEDFVAAVRAETGGRGVDVVLDILAGDYTDRNLDALAPGGRLMIISLVRGPLSTINIGTLMSKSLHMIGTRMRPRSNEYKAKVAEELRARVWPMIEAHRIKPVIDSIFPLSAAADAHRRLEGRGHIGKVMLEM